MGARGCIPHECDLGGSNTLFRDSDVPFYLPWLYTTPNAGSFCRATTGILSRGKANYTGPSIGDFHPSKPTAVPTAIPLSLSDQCALVHDIALASTLGSGINDDRALLNNLNWCESVHGEPSYNTLAGTTGMRGATSLPSNPFASAIGFKDYPFLSGSQDILNAIDSQQKNPSYTDEFIKLVDYKAPPDLTGVETRVVVDFGDLNEYRNPSTGKFQLTHLYTGP